MASSSADFLGLAGHAVFRNVRETLPKNIRKTQNVLCVRDDVLYTWDYQDNCILTLNVKASRTCENGVVHQTLLPQYPPLFSPDALLVNESNSLAVVAGSHGVLVIELPARCPPYGAFDNNKELIYCRSFSLQERTLAFSSNIEVRQVKFHPGSATDSHILMLTSDNLLRLYKVENGVATSVSVHPIGIQPMGRFPTTKTTFLEALGEVAIDFDFAPPEVRKDEKIVALQPSFKNTEKTNRSRTFTTIKERKIEPQVTWPIYVLYGNGEVYTVNIPLDGEGFGTSVKGPLPILPYADEYYGKEACAILCMHTTPPIVCIANCSGTIYHSIVLTGDYYNRVEKDRPKYIKNPDRALYVFECVELELGLTTTSADVQYSCPIFLHRNLGQNGQYFATHVAGVHTVTVSCVDNMHSFVGCSGDDVEPDADLFDEPSSAEYMICTKMASSERTNPVIGFAIYYDPLSVLVLLADGQVVSLALGALLHLPNSDSSELPELQVMNTPLKKILSKPFDSIVQRILKPSTAQPIIKLSSGGEHNNQECYELLERAAVVFREEHFKNQNRAREEIEKRVKTLAKIKQIQKGDIEQMTREKQTLQEQAEHLAEKYEDIKDKQEELTKRCERLFISVSQRQEEPTTAEKSFQKELDETEDKVKVYKNAIGKLRNKIKYQEVQMKNWHNQNEKENILGSVQTNAIKANLQEMNNKITTMMKDVNDYKKKLNLN